MARLIFVELFKLRRRLMTQVLALLVIAFFVAIQIPRWSDLRQQTFVGEAGGIEVVEEGPNGETRTIIVGQQPQSDLNSEEEAALRAQFLEATVEDNLSVVRWVAMLFGIVLTAGALGSEYSWGTLRPFLTCVESRSKYLGAKLLALGVTVLLGMAGALALAMLSSIVIAIVNGGADLGFIDGAYLEDAFFDFWRVAYSVTPYLLLTALGAIVGRSALTGAFVGFGLLIADSIATGSLQGSATWLRHIPDYLPGRNVDAMVGVRFEDVAIRDPWAAAGVIGLYTLAALAITFWVFHRRDVTA
jgi:ABC-type transport system involved in multi-copper enzyme maturation permease subunit